MVNICSLLIVLNFSAFTLTLWTDNISVIVSQIAKGILRRLKHVLPKNVLCTMQYLTLLYPHLSYCSMIWSSASPSQLKRLNVLQKWAMGHITCSKPLAHIISLFKSLNLWKLTDIVNTSCFHLLIPPRTFYQITFETTFWFRCIETLLCYSMLSFVKHCLGSSF